MIRIERLTKTFDGTPAVRDVSLAIAPGELFGFLGPNGAGKTTTLKMAAGLLRPDAGRVLIDGIDIQQQPERAKQVIGYIPDSPFLYEKLTGFEFLQFIGMLYNVAPGQLHDDLAAYRDAFRIGDWLHDRIETYSHGMRQKLVFTAAFIHNPKALIVDEPMVGLDPGSIRTVKKLLTAKCRTGLTVLMSTHTLGIAEEICDRVGIINRGNLISTGTLSNLRAAANSNGSLEDVFLTMVTEEDETIPR
ncbi:MAG: ABC transporter ATP-binding protein [Candidatus Neomarinimicrobiota bacterium]